MTDKLKEALQALADARRECDAADAEFDRVMADAMEAFALVPSEELQDER